jgi:hypothetical protein
MEEKADKPRSDVRWGIPASVVAHLVFAAIIVIGLPLELPQPTEEEAVTVEIVEPPPEPEPEPEPQPEPEPPAPVPEEQAQPEPPPPPPPEDQPQPEPEPQQEQPPQTPATEEAAEQPPSPVLRPVFEFGEETTGPRVSPDGNAATEGATEPPEEEPETAEEDSPSDAPEILAGSAADDADATTEGAPPPPSEEKSEAEQAEEQSEEVLPALTEAQTIFSEDMTDDPAARIAMADVPRELRATQLCETELTAQLRNGSPSRNPDFIPRSPLPDGTTLELRNTAFRADGRWYDLSFRCEINGEATKVVSFAFDVGDPVPRNQWRSRGFPGS